MFFAMLCQVEEKIPPIVRNGSATKLVDNADATGTQSTGNARGERVTKLALIFTALPSMPDVANYRTHLPYYLDIQHFNAIFLTDTMRVWTTAKALNAIRTVAVGTITNPRNI